MKKLLVALTVLSCMAFVLGGCNKAVETSGKEVHIQFMHQQVEQERQDAVQKIIDAFQVANPGIKVEQMPVNEDDYDTKITALGGSGELPAIMELSQDQAKSCVKNEFTDLEAVKAVITGKGEAEFFEGVLPVVKTEDGANYVGVPVSGWVQGIWCNKAMLAEKGFDVPKNWEDVLKISEAFYDPANKKYGIAVPTANVAFTEQVFSQFALSNGANVFAADKSVTFNTPEMQEAIQFYKDLAAFSMPGSTEVPEVKDAFVGKNTPMAMYSTYIIGAVKEAGFINDLAFVLPTNTTSAAYGTVTVMSISAGMDKAETEAAQKFLSFLLEDKNNIDWLHIAPGGVQPILKAVGSSDAYKDNEVIQSFAAISTDIAQAFDNLQVFGTVGGKNFNVMGDITNTGVISKTLNNVIVQGADVAAEAEAAQAEIEALAK
ncbi:MAG: extracellular solute-binding protein family 1 [Herbinix sp.]|jgi:multiple sugar transport system substrate-binding protein|nr:extracellular solute-binding protein family 1 [Herbinix sp.]